MTTIRATCPSCGDVRLKASDVVVRVCANDNKGSERDFFSVEQQNNMRTVLLL